MAQLGCRPWWSRSSVICSRSARGSRIRGTRLPGGSVAGAALHVARTACRRAERAMVALLGLDSQAFEPELLVYVNRLSDLLFVMARSANHHAGTPEIEW